MVSSCLALVAFTLKVVMLVVIDASVNASASFMAKVRPTAIACSRTLSFSQAVPAMLGNL